MSKNKSRLQDYITARGYYSVCPNELWDMPISGQAKTLYAYLLVHADHFNPPQQQMAKAISAAKGTVARALTELKEHGMITIIPAPKRGCRQTYSFRDIGDWKRPARDTSVLKENHSIVKQEPSICPKREPLVSHNEATGVLKENHNKKNIKRTEEDKLKVRPLVEPRNVLEAEKPLGQSEGDHSNFIFNNDNDNSETSRTRTLHNRTRTDGKNENAANELLEEATRTKRTEIDDDVYPKTKDLEPRSGNEPLINNHTSVEHDFDSIQEKLDGDQLDEFFCDHTNAEGGVERQAIIERWALKLVEGNVKPAVRRPTVDRPNEGSPTEAAAPQPPKSPTPANGLSSPAIVSANTEIATHPFKSVSEAIRGLAGDVSMASQGLEAKSTEGPAESTSGAAVAPAEVTRAIRLLFGSEQIEYDHPRTDFNLRVQSSIRNLDNITNRHILAQAGEFLPSGYQARAAIYLILATVGQARGWTVPPLSPSQKEALAKAKSIYADQMDFYEILVLKRYLPDETDTVTETSA